MTVLNEAKVTEIMAKVAPNLHSGLNPSEQTAEAFREYITFALMKKFMEAYQSYPADTQSIQVSLSFEMTAEANNIIKLLCTPHGWPREMFVRFDNS